MNAPYRSEAFMAAAWAGIVLRRLGRAVVAYNRTPTVENLRWLVAARRAAIKAGLHRSAWS